MNVHARRLARAQRDSDRTCVHLNARRDRYGRREIWAVHYDAVNRITWANQTGQPFAEIVLPDPVGHEALNLHQAVLNLASWSGRSLRPGGSHGSSASLIRFER